ncbi:MAG: hypothetical protein WBN03_07665 [Desulfobacterales bacterium]
MPDQNQPQEALEDARSIVNILLQVLRMLSFYAEGHTNCQAGFIRLQKDLGNFLEKYKEFSLKVEKNRLLFGDAVVYEGAVKDGDLAFALFRDGIFELSFQNGLEAHETQVFVEILHRYKVLPAEAEGDIVTALWESQLPHVRYEAADSIIETDSEGGLSSPEENGPLPGGTSSWQGPDIFDSLETVKQDDASSVLTDKAKEWRRVDATIFELKTEEITALQEMVLREEERDATGEILNMMADILKDQQNQEFFDVVLAYLSEELQMALARKNFDNSLRILVRLHQIRKLSVGSTSWARSKIKEFFMRASEKKFLAALHELWPKMTAADLEKAQKTLILLSPVSIGAFGPMFCETRAPSVLRMLAKVIVTLAARDMKPFVTLLDTVEEDLVHRLVPLLGQMKDESSARILLKMTQHPGERVRMEALKAIMMRDLWIPEKLVFLLDDENSIIRQLYLDYLASRRSKSTEGILLAYLQKKRFRSHDKEYLSACFRTLGKCGTTASIAYLKNALLKGGLISRFRASARRKGAAIALMELGSEKARQVLLEASRSGFPGIRNVAQSIL